MNGAVISSFTSRSQRQRGKAREWRAPLRFDPRSQEFPIYVHGERNL